MTMSSAQRRLSAMLALTAMFFLVEIIVGYITNSMALIADSFHMFSDAIALVIAFISVRMSPKKWSKNTFGWARAEILGALVNAVFLCALCFSILIESIKRFTKPDLIHDPHLILIVGGLGLFINLIGLLLFMDGGSHFHHHHGHGHHHHHHHHLPIQSNFIVCQGDSDADNSNSETQKKKYGLLCKHQSHSNSQEYFCRPDHDHETTPSPDGHNDSDESRLTVKFPISDKAAQGHKSNISESNSTSDIHLTFRQANKQDYGSSAAKPTTPSVGHKHHQHVDVDCGSDEKHSHSHHGNSKPSPPSSTQMNMRGVFLHVMADALGSVIVMISALVVIYTDSNIKYYIDPILSVLMVCLILRSTWPLLTESAMILLQTVPTHIEVDSLRRRLTQEIHGVLAVHEFHVWQLAGDRIIASAHILCHNLQDYMRIAEKVKEFFHNEGIHSTTIQPEFVEFENGVYDESNDDNCALDCPSNQRTNCAPQTCCGGQRSSNGANESSNNEDLLLTRRAKPIGASSSNSGSGDMLDASRLNVDLTRDGDIQTTANV